MSHTHTHRQAIYVPAIKDLHTHICRGHFISFADEKRVRCSSPSPSLCHFAQLHVSIFVFFSLMTVLMRSSFFLLLLLQLAGGLFEIRRGKREREREDGLIELEDKLN